MKKKVTVMNPTVNQNDLKRLKVAAYCRVSTGNEDQASSLKTQIAYFTNLICENPDWEFAGIYADQKTGVNMEIRDEMNRMLRDCDNGKIDLILTKSMSRFSRNTLDTLVTLQHLREKNIEVRFDTDNISTADYGVHQAIVAAAAMAQHESHSRSENIKWGIRYGFQQGKTRLNHTNFLGYTKDDHDNLVIVPEEAEIVRLIYSLYLDGYGSRKIADYLERNGIKTVTGKKKWSTSTIDRILINEKYVGCLITQKSYTDNFLNGKQVKNTGEILQHRFENHHEAIIDRETFEKVQKKKHNQPFDESEAPAITQSM